VQNLHFSLAFFVCRLHECDYAAYSDVTSRDIERVFGCSLFGSGHAWD